MEWLGFAVALVIAVPIVALLGVGLGALLGFLVSSGLLK